MEVMKQYTRLKSLILTFIVYCFALFVAVFFSLQFSSYNQWVVILVAHVAATLVVFLFSKLFNNSSLYDPFWSIAPLPIIIYLSLWPSSGELDYLKILLICIPITFWSIRLTVNWIRRWEGLNEEDFRYINLKKLPFSELVDLFGIHVYPTLQVNLSLLPVYFALSISTAEVNWLLYVSSIFTILAIILETIADEQLIDFKKNKSNYGKTMKTGLWSLSRHPNYLGEVLFWWGLFFMTLSLDFQYWYLFICPLIMN